MFFFSKIFGFNLGQHVVSGERKKAAAVAALVALK